MLEQKPDDPDEDEFSNGRNFLERREHSALFNLAKNGTQCEILTLFKAKLESIPDVDYIRDSRLNTLLHAAVSSKNLEAVKVVIQKGANLKALNLDCETPWSLARSFYLDSLRSNRHKKIYNLFSSRIRESNLNLSLNSDPGSKSPLSASGPETTESANIPNELLKCLDREKDLDVNESSSVFGGQFERPTHAKENEDEAKGSETPNKGTMMCQDEVLDAEVGSSTEGIGRSYSIEDDSNSEEDSVSEKSDPDWLDSVVESSDTRSSFESSLSESSECSNKSESVKSVDIKEHSRTARVINLSVDDLRSLTERIGVSYPPEEGMIHLPPDTLYRINTFRDSKRNSLLERFAEKGDVEVMDFLLRCEGLVHSKKFAYGVSYDYAWRNKDYVRVLTLIKSDAYFPRYFKPSEIDDSVSGAKDLKEFVYRRNELHKNIESGNLEAVMEATKFRNSSLYLNWNNESALHRSGMCRDYRGLNIYAYFLSIGLSYGEGEEASTHTDAECCIIRNLTEKYVERKTSTVERLMASSKLLGEYDENTEEIVEYIHRRLYECSSISKLMNVLKYEPYEAYFDFGRESGQCVWFRKRGNDRRGLCNSRQREIYIGAKKYLRANYDDGLLLNEFAGKLAHAICHVAMDVQYENNSSKPYRSNDERMIKKIEESVREIKSKITDCPGEIHDLIKMVFEEQKSEDWHRELVAVVPQILAIHGEQKGGEILKSQVPKLYEIYEWQIVLRSIEYSQDEAFVYLLNKMKSEKILNDDDFVEKMNSRRYFLDDKLTNFRDYLNSHENLSILVTTNVSLSRYLIYHRLRSKYSFRVDRICLFFDLFVFLKYCDLILNAYKCRYCKYLIIYTDDKDVNYEDISAYFSDEFLEKENKPILIISSDCKHLKCEWNNNIMDYKWGNLSQSSKCDILLKKVYFQGDEWNLKSFLRMIKFGRYLFPVDISWEFEMNVPYNTIFQREVLWYLLSHRYFVIGNSKNLCTSNLTSKDTVSGFSSRVLRDVIYITIIDNCPEAQIFRLFGIKSILIVGKFYLSHNFEEFRLCKIEFSRTWKKEILKKIKNKSPSEIHCYDPLTDECYSNFSKEMTLKIDALCKTERARQNELFREHMKKRITSSWGDCGELVPGICKMKFLWASTISSPAFSGFLQMMKRIMCIKALNGDCVQKSEEFSLRDSEEANKMFDEIKKSLGMEEMKKILEERDSKGWTMLHATSINRDEGVLPKFLSFIEDILGGENLGMYFSARSNQEQTILHLCSMSHFYYIKCERILSVLKVLPKFFLRDKESLISLLEHPDFRGFNFLHYLVWNANEDVLGNTFDLLEKEIGGVYLKRMFSHRNEEGMNVLQQASSNPDIKIFEKVLTHARRAMDDSEFVDLVIGCDNRGNTIFHTRASVVGLMTYDDLRERFWGESSKKFRNVASVSDLMVLDSYMEDSGRLQRLMMKENDTGVTFLNANTDFSMSVIFCAVYMIDPENLVKFLSSQDSNGNCYLHKIAGTKQWYWKRRMHLAFMQLSLYLPPSSIKKLMNVKNAVNESVSDIMLMINQSETELFEKVRKMLNRI